MSLFQISDEKLLDEAYDNIRWLQNNRISLQESVSHDQYEDLLNGLVESVQLFEDARDALKKYNATGNALISSHQNININNSINSYLTNYTAKKNALKAQMEKVKRMRAQGKPIYFSFKGQDDFIKKSKWNSLPEERRKFNKEFRADAKKQGLPFKQYMRNVKMTSGTSLDPTTKLGAAYLSKNKTIGINKKTFKILQKDSDYLHPNESDKEKLKRHMKFRHGNLAHELTHKAQDDYLIKKFGKDSPEYKQAWARTQAFVPGDKPGIIKVNPNYFKNPMEYHAYINGGNAKSLRDRSFNKLSDQHKKDLDASATKNDKDYENYIDKHTDLFKLPGQEKADVIGKAVGKHIPYMALKQSGKSDEDIDKIAKYYKE